MFSLKLLRFLIYDARENKICENDFYVIYFKYNKLFYFVLEIIEIIEIRDAHEFRVSHEEL